mmetsp:Transcript_124267/g.362811  ORF Transcript_124267/g.362811 Transcript_124267/m.362811 type:complete len:287 (-) Transcript_124267:929-1789(-)
MNASSKRGNHTPTPVLSCRTCTDLAHRSRREKRRRHVSMARPSANVEMLLRTHRCTSTMARWTEPSAAAPRWSATCLRAARATRSPTMPSNSGRSSGASPSKSSFSAAQTSRWHVSRSNTAPARSPISSSLKWSGASEATCRTPSTSAAVSPCTLKLFTKSLQAARWKTKTNNSGRKGGSLMELGRYVLRSSPSVARRAITLLTTKVSSLSEVIPAKRSRNAWVPPGLAGGGCGCVAAVQARSSSCGCQAITADASSTCKSALSCSSKPNVCKHSVAYASSSSPAK